uniref:Uncharacterized protein n=1 Tax=Cacopsylla melanoneura TaxID=428564 RepID=A0A8D8TJH5_9HEMI
MQWLRFFCTIGRSHKTVQPAELSIAFSKTNDFIFEPRSHSGTRLLLFENIWIVTDEISISWYILKKFSLYLIRYYNTDHVFSDEFFWRVIERSTKDCRLFLLCTTIWQQCENYAHDPRTRPFWNHSKTKQNSFTFDVWLLCRCVFSCLVNFLTNGGCCSSPWWKRWSWCPWRCRGKRR